MRTKSFCAKNTLFFAASFLLVMILCFVMGCENPANGKDKPSVLSGNIAITGDLFVGKELTANYSGNEAVTFQWNKDGTAIVGKTAKTFTPSEAGTYTVTVSAEGYESKTSAAVAVTEFHVLSGNITITPNTEVIVGDELTASYSGEEAVTYQWNKDGTAIAGKTGTTFTPEAAGSYTVTVSAEGYESKTSAAVTVTVKIGDGTPHFGPKYIEGTNEAVKTYVYVEVNNNNPLNAGSYILEDGTYFFDHVILFAANIRQRNCGADPGNNAGCTESGPHVHFNDNVKYILDNKAKYIEPLQAKGIKVLLGLLGDHDGIGFSAMTDAQIATFVADLKADIERYDLDGVDFDDEWASSGEGPQDIFCYPRNASQTKYRNPNMGFVPGNVQSSNPGTTAVNAMYREQGEIFYKTIKATREALGPEAVIGFYEFDTAEHITAGGNANGVATASGLSELIDFVLFPMYGNAGMNENGVDSRKYSLLAIDIGGNAYGQGGEPLPRLTEMGDQIELYKNHPFGDVFNVLYFYDLTESSKYLRRSQYGAFDLSKAEYLSRWSESLFGQETVLIAGQGDYKKDW